MSTLSEQERLTLKNCQSFRLNGQYQAAVQTLQPLIAGQMQNAEVLVEALKLVVLINDMNQMSQLHGMIQQIPGVTLDPTLKARVQQKLGSTEIDDPWKDSGCLLTHIAVDGQSGATHYTFSLECQHCQHHVDTKSLASLYFKRELLCPHCFNALVIDTHMIQKFIKDSQHIMNSDTIESHDSYINQLQKKIGQYDNDNIPMICRGLNQNMIFFMNQLVTNRLNKKS